MRSLSSTVAETPSTCSPSRRVVSKTSTCRFGKFAHGAGSLSSGTGPENARSRPEAASACTGMGHVHYGMMMIASAVQVGEITPAIQPVAERPRQPRTGAVGARPLWASLCMNGG